MRPDMFELLLERPRAYRGCRSRKAPPYPRGSLRPRSIEDAPLTEAMGFAYRDRSLNENLSPLERWLGRQVGRPWRLVYAEVSEHLSPKNAVKMHVRDHLRDFVVTCVTYVDGVLYGAGRYGFAPVLSYRSRRALYVCPRTGLLREGPRAPSAANNPNVKPLADGRYLVKRCGVFHLVITALSTEKVCALTGLRRDSTAYHHARRTGLVPWPSDRVAVSAFVPSKKLLRELFREAGWVAVAARK